ncbi:hypothetical protein [Blastochloris viridis]|uniref:Transposase n=1 Tax=Blastochloris viridis TaxID=1079 RepID=A0A0P0IZK3_BLAVI|nr:hypothetical protein [Blastochloris viridis]ALK09301.1 hypothetical protein BVIR_1519 [Blastochloris viridis]CUU41964.1 hypothetical protein BVIRIDIS_09640 [Blastochloris viridis]
MSVIGRIAPDLAELQQRRFPSLPDGIGPRTAKNEQLAIVLGMVRIEGLVPHWRGLPGRPLAERPPVPAASSPRR